MNMPRKRKSPPLPSCYTIHNKKGSLQSHKSEPAEDERCGDASDVHPFVEHCDGRQFWSDRFYLNENSSSANNRKHVVDPPLDRDFATINNSSGRTPDRPTCNCGSSEPPPAFPLIDFVNQSLDVKAAVMGTFSLHPEWFRRNFPRFGARENNESSNASNQESPSIPTMILHGHRGLGNALKERVKQADELEYETDGDDDCVGAVFGNPPMVSDDGSTQSSVKFQFFLPMTGSATAVARDFVDNPNLKLCQVFSNWDKSRSTRNNSNNNRRVSFDKENGANHKSSNTIETKFGVHHPKFMLLFERSGDLVVIISTSNLVPTEETTVEGSWVQRFRRRCNGDAKIDGTDNTNDFGPVLQDFLIRQAEAAAAGGGKKGIHNRRTKFPLEEFLSEHIGIDSLKDFASAFCFETAKAYLVPVVPGDYEYDPNRDNPKNDKRSGFHYGRQRVRYILDTLVTSVPKISKRTKDATKSDRLLLQPTSLSGGWTRSEWASLVREYMGYYSGGDNSITKPRKSNSNTKVNDDDCDYHWNDFWVSRQADILWPSDRYMVECASAAAGIGDLRDGKTADHIVSHLQAARKGYRGREANIHSLSFNSSRTFNKCDYEFISRMAVYQPSSPCQHIVGHRKIQQKIPSAPHFKSIARLFPNHAAMEKRGIPPADAYFSWFLMTSACLSLGAQGAAIQRDTISTNENKSTKSDCRGSEFGRNKDTLSSQSPPIASVVGYSNFELGVLFVSRVPKKKPKTMSSQSGLVYCFHPRICSCRTRVHRGSTANRTPQKSNSEPAQVLVHLPVPYEVRPDSYFQSQRRNNSNTDENEDGQDDYKMIENPFFHEVLEGSRCVGNMLLTPFGQAERETEETIEP